VVDGRTSWTAACLHTTVSHARGDVQVVAAADQDDADPWCPPTEPVDWEVGECAVSDSHERGRSDDAEGE
jgi:hypothetical protein